jgi:hypothetical protein
MRKAFQSQFISKRTSKRHGVAKARLELARERRAKRLAGLSVLLAAESKALGEAFDVAIADGLSVESTDKTPARGRGASQRDRRTRGNAQRPAAGQEKSQ